MAPEHLSIEQHRHAIGRLVGQQGAGKSCPTSAARKRWLSYRWATGWPVRPATAGRCATFPFLHGEPARLVGVRRSFSWAGTPITRAATWRWDARAGKLTSTTA